MISKSSITPFSDRVKRAARITGIYKKAEIARRLNCSQQLVQSWSKANDVRYSTACKVAEAYGMTLAEFFTDD